MLEKGVTITSEFRFDLVLRSLFAYHSVQLKILLSFQGSLRCKARVITLRTNGKEIVVNRSFEHNHRQNLEQLTKVFDVRDAYALRSN